MEQSSNNWKGAIHYSNPLQLPQPHFTYQRNDYRMLDLPLTPYPRNKRPLSLYPKNKRPLSRLDINTGLDETESMASTVPGRNNCNLILKRFCGDSRHISPPFSNISSIELTRASESVLNQIN